MNTETPRTSPAAIASVLVPILIAAIGALWAFTTPLSQNDWFGMALVARAYGALMLASIVSIAFAVATFVRGEPKSGISLFTAIPSFIFLVYTGSILIPAYSENARLKRMQEIRRRVVAEATYRQAFVMSPDLSIKDARIFKDQVVADSLTPDQVRHLWHLWKGVETGWNYQALIISKNTPPDVLTEYYQDVIAKATRADWKPPQKYLEYEEYLLRHPNLPEPLIAEIQAFNIPAVNIILARRKPEPNPESCVRPERSGAVNTTHVEQAREDRRR